MISNKGRTYPRYKTVFGQTGGQGRKGYECRSRPPMRYPPRAEHQYGPNAACQVPEAKEEEQIHL